MNTPGSVAYGWGALIFAGAISYYFAKKDIDARRREQARLGIRPTEELTWEERVARDEERMRQEVLQKSSTGNEAGSINKSKMSDPGASGTSGGSSPS